MNRRLEEIRFIPSCPPDTWLDKNPHGVLVGRLRRELKLSESDTTDESILETTRGSFLRARIEFGLAMDKFIKAVMGKLWKS